MSAEGRQDFDPATGWSRPLIRLLSKSIELANKLNRDSWVIVQVGEEAHVNVGQRNICEMGGEKTVLLIDLEDLRSRGRHPGHECQVLDWRDNNKEKFASLRKIAFAPVDTERVIKKYKNSHFVAVQKVREKATPFRGDHHPGLWKEFRRIADENVEPSRT